MVCHRCILSVEGILAELTIPYDKVSVGEIVLEQMPEAGEIKLLGESLKRIGLELIDNKQSALIEKLKQLIIQKARNEVEENAKNLKLSGYISNHVPYEYTYISSLFSDVEGRTIENYYIEQRIEKVKELLVYGQLSLSEIAFQLDYSSVAHLSSQFKKITGLTPSHYKSIGDKRRNSLDAI